MTESNDTPGSLTRVRIARDGDIPALAALRAAWEGVAPEPAFERRLADWVAREGDRRTIWVAEAGGAAIGMASLYEYRRMPWPGRPDARWGYVGSMFVAPEHRDRGVGSALLGAITATAEERGYARLLVAPSERSTTLYRRGGFIAADGSEGGEILLRRPGRSR